MYFMPMQTVLHCNKGRGLVSPWPYQRRGQDLCGVAMELSDGPVEAVFFGDRDTAIEGVIEQLGGFEQRPA